MTFITIDIETVPQARFLEPARYEGESPEFEVAPSWWEAGVADDLEDFKANAPLGVLPLAATGVVPALHATTCHVVQVSFGWPGCSKVIQWDDVMEAADSGRTTTPEELERRILTRAFDLMAAATKKGTTLVSFNGKGFDIPILRARAALLALPMPALPWRKLIYPYADDRHADLRLVLSADDRRARGTLQWWADAMGIHAEEHGAEVSSWVQAGEWSKLRAYGETEARTLVELYERLLPIL